MFFAEWFPTPLLKDTLEPPDDVRQAMIDYVVNEEKNSDRESRSYFLGDDHGSSSIHQNSCFDWLNKEVGRCAHAYLHKLGCDTNNVNIYAQKSWAVILKEGGRVGRHTHKNSVLSAVYYLQIPTVSGGGEITFWSDNKLHDLPIVSDQKTVVSAQSFHDVPQENGLIMFPSNLTHSVSTFGMKEHQRISISYDITPCFNDSSMQNEHWIMDPSFWTKL